jgi:nitrous oxide reductase accessory protein NosL
MIRRRAFLASAFALAVAACRRDGEKRCATCGMKMDPASPWRAELITAGGPVAFDSPRCAFLAWRGGRVSATALRVQDFYDRAWKDGAEVRFVVGSDVVGPMGSDLVPVDPARVAKFLVDHRAPRALTVDEVTAAVLATLT